MKTKQELSDILDFVAEYASYLLGSGVHTSRVIRNAQRIGTSQGVDIQLSSFQKSIIITVHDERSGEDPCAADQLRTEFGSERFELGCRR